jgi:hypothetical protein
MTINLPAVTNKTRQKRDAVEWQRKAARWLLGLLRLRYSLATFPHKVFQTHDKRSGAFKGDLR